MDKLKGEINTSTVTAGNFNIPLRIKGRTTRQINKDTGLEHTTN